MFAAPLQCTLADLPTMWEISPPQCKLLVYQDRRHLFVTPFYQLRVGERVLQTLQHQPYLKY
jgi:hypothetical protein